MYISPPIDLTASNPAEQLVALGDRLRAHSYNTALTSVLPVLSRFSGLVAGVACGFANWIDENPAWKVSTHPHAGHYLEIALTAMAYAEAERAAPTPCLRRHQVLLVQEDIEDIFIAGLIHVLGSPKENNGAEPFKLEKQSWTLAQSSQLLTKYHGARLERLRTLVFATYPHIVPAVERAMARLVAPDAIISLLNLNELEHPRTTVLAYLLTKAAITSSLLSFDNLSTHQTLGAGTTVVNADGALQDPSFVLEKIDAACDSPLYLDVVERTLGVSARAIKARPSPLIL